MRRDVEEESRHMPSQKLRIGQFWRNLRIPGHAPAGGGEANSIFIQTDGIFHNSPPVFFGKLTFFNRTLAFQDDYTII